MFREIAEAALEWLESYDGKSDLNEDEFKEIVGSKLKPLGIMTGEDFEKTHECGITEKYVYDPLAKAYVGKKNPIFDNGQITDGTDLIEAGLKAQGLPSDEDSIENLSLEDAYAALAVALGYGNDGNDDE